MAEPAGPLVPVLERPFNAETPTPLLAATITPSESFFVRSHFDVPAIDPTQWRLTVDGVVEREVRLSLTELQRMPATTVALTLECAGNGRTSLHPRPEGVAWGLGAASTARFTGVPLKTMLDLAVPGRALEAVFTAADQGEAAGQVIPFARSLPLAVARHPDTVLAWAMNDVPLTPAHGAPVRLVVPGWYGMASVKWLERITLAAEPFTGYFQQSDYVYLRQAGVPDGTPVTMMRVRAVIARPLDESEHPLAPLEIRGTAWSGTGAIRRVSLSVDGGVSWNDASLESAASEYAATAWNFSWRPSARGRFTIIARATDEAGNVQPLQPVWNARGYGNNSAHRVHITIR
jgi:DMSO/TMAO reductase YedYZ molybdopterin-dependent catalytic subunit